MRQGRSRNDGLGMIPGSSKGSVGGQGTLRVNPGRFGNKTREMRIESCGTYYVCYLSSLFRNDPGIITIATCIIIM